MVLHSGNQFAMNILESAIKNDSPFHGVLFYGESGTGKKTMALQYAKKLLCENKDSNGNPCNKCKACIQIEKETHPDIYIAKKTGKLGVISAGTSTDTQEGSVRDLRSKLFEYPIEGKAKIIILPDCVNAGSWIQAQNMLLKILEEPPEFGYIIFTAEDKSIFLDTILSRIVSLRISPCTANQNIDILKQKKYDENSILDAVKVYGGNTGKCIEYIENPESKAKVEYIKNFLKSIEFKREYDALKYLKKFSKDRHTLSEALSLIENMVRDAVIISNCGDLYTRLGISEDLAHGMSDSLNILELKKIYKAVSVARKNIQANIRPDFVASSFCAYIFDI